MNSTALKNVKSTVLRSHPFRVRRLLRLFVNSYEYISTYVRKFVRKYADFRKPS